jgi:fumarate reductase flavoprotein subunit
VNAEGKTVSVGSYMIPLLEENCEKAGVKDGKTYIYDNENAVTTEFTKGKVQNTSGGTTCPSIRPNLTVWVWVKQTTNGNWQY